jgi:hypothetical protein
MGAETHQSKVRRQSGAIETVWDTLPYMLLDGKLGKWARQFQKELPTETYTALCCRHDELQALGVKPVTQQAEFAELFGGGEKGAKKALHFMMVDEVRQGIKQWACDLAKRDTMRHAEKPVPIQEQALLDKRIHTRREKLVGKLMAVGGVQRFSANILADRVESIISSELGLAR